MIFEKDPDEVLDYGFDWSAWLAGDTIATSTWTITPSGPTSSNPTKDATSTTVWLSGGTNGGQHTVVNRITTAGGRTAEKALTVVIQAN